MAYKRYSFENFFVTTMSDDHTLTPGVDWTLPLVMNPTEIEDWKLFFIVLNVNDIWRRKVLPVYMDWWLVKYKWYNINTLYELYKYDDVAINDISEAFNTLFELTDDIGKIVQKIGLDIMVYGWDVIIGNDQYSISDTDITLNDNKTLFIVLDYADQVIKAVETLPDAYYQFATIVTSWWSISSIVWKRAFNVQNFFSSLFFEKDTNWEVIIKDWSITWLQINFNSFDADDIFEWATHKFLTPTERTNIANNTTARHTHSNKAILDTYDQTNANITDSVNKKHSHTNKSTLDLFPDFSSAAEWDVPQKFGNTIVWWPSGGGSWWTTTAWIDVFLWDGISDSFTLSHSPLNDNFIFMTNDSGINYFNGVDYTRVWNVITFSQIPESNRKIYVRYFQQLNIAQVWEANTMSNLPWSGIGVYQQKSWVEFLMRRIDGINGITVTQVWDQIIIDWHVTVWPGWEANTASNVWSWIGLFKIKSWVDLRFKSIWSSDTITVTESLDWDNIEIDVNEEWLQKRYFMHRLY